MENSEKDFNLWVNESNSLIMSLIEMKTTELSLFLFMVAHMNPQDPDFDGWIYAKKSDIFEYFGYEANNKYTWFRNTIINMQNSAFCTVYDAENKKYTRHSMIPNMEWYEQTNDMAIELNKNIIPYIHDLEKYTKTDLNEIRKIRDKKHAIILYRYLNMNYRQYISYKDTKKRTEHQLELLKNPEIDEKTIRFITDTKDVYGRFIDLDKKVVKDAIDTINAKTRFEVTYERLKNGRKPIGFKFYVSEKFVAPLPQNMKSREEIAKEFAEQFTKAFSSPYMVKLMGVHLLSTEDMANQEFHVKLLEDVYPLYDKIRASKDSYGVTGEELLEKHLSYVASKMLNPSMSNMDKTSIPSGFGLVKYLKKSAQDFINSQLS